MLVKRLCDENNARIVISSACREMYCKEAIEAILNAACAGLGDLVWNDEKWWRTTLWPYEGALGETSDRGREILHWLSNSGVLLNNYVILDDMADMRPLNESLILCSTNDGIGYSQYIAASAMLKAG